MGDNAKSGAAWRDVNFTDVGTERVLIGYLAHYPGRFGAVGVDVRHFHDPTCRTIFEAMRAVHAAGALDYGTLMLGVVRTGGAALGTALNDLWNEYEGKVAEEGLLVERLKEVEKRRRLWTLGSELRRIAADHAEDLGAAAGVADGVVEALCDGGALEVHDLRDVALRLVEEKARRLDGAFDGFKSGIRALDARIGGWERRHMHVIAARPGAGKSASGRQFALSAARHGARVLLCSGEMPNEEVAAGVLAQEARIDLTTIRDAHVGAVALGPLREAATELPAGGVWLYDKPGMTSEDVESVARRMHYRKPLDLVVVDYVQLMADEADPREPRTYVVGRITRRLRNMARRLNVALLGLAQLNRESEKDGKRRRPVLADLGESSSLEKDADLVVFIYHPEDRPGVVEWIVEKNRHGPKGNVEGRWTGEHTRFDDAPWEEGGA